MEKTISWTQSNIFLEGNMSHRVNASSPYGVHPYSPWFFGWLDICSLLFHECSRSLEHYNRYNLYCWYNMYSSRVNIVASDALAVKTVWAWNIVVATVQVCRPCFSILRHLQDISRCQTKEPVSDMMEPEMSTQETYILTYGSKCFWNPNY